MPDTLTKYVLVINPFEPDYKVVGPFPTAQEARSCGIEMETAFQVIELYDPSSLGIRYTVPL